MPAWFTVPRMTRRRMALAVVTAVVVDGVQLLLGPVGIFSFFDDLLDLIAAVIISLAIGFHPLLLPTFIAELVPFVDMMPTWTGCTIAVVALRKRREATMSTTPVPPDPEHMKRANVIEEPPLPPKV